jgi:hypothetical protein
MKATMKALTQYFRQIVHPILSGWLNVRVPQFVFVRPDVRPVRRKYQRF